VIPALEAVGAAEDLDAREHRLDDLCGATIELVAGVGDEFVAHLLVGPLAACEARLAAPGRIRAHQHSHPALAEPVYVAEVVEPGIG
jgi:hypothetical protein